MFPQGSFEKKVCSFATDVFTQGVHLKCKHGCSICRAVPYINLDDCCSSGATLGLKHEELRKVLKKLPQIVSEGPLAEVVYLVVTNHQCNTSSTNLEIQQ